MLVALTRRMLPVFEAEARRARPTVGLACHEPGFHSGRCCRRPRGAAVLATLGTLTAAQSALATTCIYQPSTLADSYVNAATVVVAQVDACADRGIPADGRCPQDSYHLNVLEVLKESKPPRDFSGAYTGAGVMGCGIRLTVGESYLLFIAGPGSIDHDASGALQGRTGHTRTMQQTLEILREYRDGAIDDLADPWLFVDDGLGCLLSQNVAGSSLTFSFPYSQKDVAHYALSFEYDEDGYIERVDAFPPVPGFGPQVEAAFEGADITLPRTLLFSVSFHPPIGAVRDSASVQVGNRSWNLSTRVMTLRIDGKDLPEPLVTDLAWGDAAQEILAAMLAPSDVVVRKRHSAADIAAAPRFDGDGVASIETRTTRLGEQAVQFEACVDGSIRRPPPAGL